MRGRLLVGVTIVALVGGLAWWRVATRGAVGAVPYSTAAAAPDPAHGPITRPGINRCATSDMRLEVTGHPYPNGGPVNTSFWPISISNTGPEPCWIQPGLALQFLTPGGAAIATETLAFGRDIIYLTRSGATPPITAIGEISINCSLPTGTRIGVSTGDGSWTMVDPGIASGTARQCPVTGRTQSVISMVSSREEGGALGEITATAANVPAELHRGTRVRFLVDLKGDWEPGRHLVAGSRGPRTLTLDPCPTFDEEVEGTIDSFERHPLNCARAQPVRAGGSEEFEMYITVPPDAPLGPTQLAWSLYDPSRLWARLRVRVSVTR